jgi:chromosome segregation ATPase
LLNFVSVRTIKGRTNQLREAQEAVEEYGKKLEDAEDQKEGYRESWETAEKERDAILTDYHALQEELERLRRSSEAFTRDARRRTLFDKLPEAVPDVFGMRRKSTMLKQQADGKRTLMDGGELLTTFLTEMKESLPSNKGIIVDKITELGKYIAKGDEEFAELARASGVIVGSMGRIGRRPLARGPEEGYHCSADGNQAGSIQDS